MIEKTELILIGYLYSYSESIEKLESLSEDDIFQYIINCIDYINEYEDKLARDVTDLLCCISACAHTIDKLYPSIGDRHTGINWKKLALFKREISMEFIISPARARPREAGRGNGQINKLQVALVCFLVKNFIIDELVTLKSALIRINDNPAYRQTEMLNCTINRLIEYRYDEALLTIIARTSQEFYKLFNLQNNQEINASLLYNLLLLGEALTHLSSFLFSQLPHPLSGHLIQVRNLLCHAEREYSWSIISNLLHGSRQHPIINMNLIANLIPSLIKSVFVQLNKYTEDASDLSSLDCPKVQNIGRKIKSESEPGCDLFLMSSEIDVIKISDKNHLYLYKDKKEKIYYKIQGKDENQYLEDMEIKGSLKDEAFNQPMENPIRCKKNAPCSTVLKETLKRGDTCPANMSDEEYSLRRIEVSCNPNELEKFLKKHKVTFDELKENDRNRHPAQRGAVIPAKAGLYTQSGKEITEEEGLVQSIQEEPAQFKQAISQPTNKLEPSTTSSNESGASFFKVDKNTKETYGEGNCFFHAAFGSFLSYESAVVDADASGHRETLISEIQERFSDFLDRTKHTRNYLIQIIHGLWFERWNNKDSDLDKERLEEIYTLNKALIDAVREEYHKFINENDNAAAYDAVYHGFIDIITTKTPDFFEKLRTDTGINHSDKVWLHNILNESKYAHYREELTQQFPDNWEKFKQDIHLLHIQNDNRDKALFFNEKITENTLRDLCRLSLEFFNQDGIYIDYHFSAFMPFIFPQNFVQGFVLERKNGNDTEIELYTTEDVQRKEASHIIHVYFNGINHYEQNENYTSNQRGVVIPAEAEIYAQSDKENYGLPQQFLDQYFLKVYEDISKKYKLFIKLNNLQESTVEADSIDLTFEIKKIENKIKENSEEKSNKKKNNFSSFNFFSEDEDPFQDEPFNLVDEQKKLIGLYKLQVLPLLDKLIYFLSEAISSNIGEASKFYIILAGSYSRALLDRQSLSLRNAYFIQDIEAIELKCDFPIGEISLYEGLNIFVRGSRGYFSHLRQPQIGEAKIFDLYRWPYEESDLRLEFIKNALETLKKLQHSYASFKALLEESVSPDSPNIFMFS